MKYIFSSFTLLALLFMPIGAHAAQFEAGEAYNLGDSEVLEENAFLIQSSISIAGDTQEDVFAVAETFTLIGNIEKDLAVVGSSVQILGDVGDDLRGAAESFTLVGSVDGELMLIGAIVNLEKESVIAKDAYVMGATLRSNGVIHGDATLMGDIVHLNGTVDGDVIVKADSEFIIGDNVVIGGSLVYEAPHEIGIPASAQINGEVEFRKITPKEATPEIGGIFSAFKSTFKIFSLFAFLATTLLFFFVFRKKSEELFVEGTKDFGFNLLRGFILLIVAPIASVILLVTMVGSNLGAILGFIYVAMLLIAKPFGAIFLGGVIAGAVKKDKPKSGEHLLPWYVPVIGVAIYWILGFIPVLGWIAKLVFTLTALGAMLYAWYKEVWLKR